MAKDIAPVKTGEYRDSIESGTFADGDRFTGYVAATVDYALAVEAKDRVLTRAIDAADIIPNARRSVAGSSCRGGGDSPPRGKSNNICEVFVLSVKFKLFAFTTSRLSK